MINKLKHNNQLIEQDLLVLSAYTGYAFTAFDTIHEFMEEVLKRPLPLLIDEEVREEIQTKLKSDFYKVLLKMNSQSKKGGKK